MTTTNQAAVFKGQLTKLLGKLGIEFSDANQTQILTGTVDPTATATTASAGSVYINTSQKQIYIKQDAGSSTNWIPLDVSRFFSGVQRTGVIDVSTQTFTASGKTISVGGSRTYGVAGIKFTKSNTETLAADGTGGSASAGMRFYYYDSAQTLKQSVSFLDFTTQAVAYIGFAYFDGTNLTRAALEPHKYDRNVFWHYVQHLSTGMVYSSGIDATYTTTSGGPGAPAIAAATDATASMILSGGLLFDEDVPINITHTLTPGTLPYGQNLGTAQSMAAGFGPSFVKYNGVTGVFDRVAPMSDKTIFPYTGAQGAPQWNNQATGTLTALTDQQFGVYWIIACNNVNNAITGQTAETIFVRPHNNFFTTLVAAQAAAVTDLTWTNFPVAEYKVMYRVIFEYRTAYLKAPAGSGNSTHGCTVREVIDYRKSNLSNAAISSGTVSAASVAVSTAGFTGALQGLTSGGGTVPLTNNNQQLIDTRIDQFGYVGAWSAALAGLGFNVGNVVSYQGKFWRCVAANNSSTFTPAEWSARSVAVVDTVANAKTYVGNDGEMIWCQATSTLYRFSAGGAYTNNDTSILDAPTGNFWIGIAGSYSQVDLGVGYRYLGGAGFAPLTTNSSTLGTTTKIWSGVFSAALDTQSTTNTTLGIGTTYATTINIGRAGATVNVYGDTFYVAATNTTVADKLITLNKGGAAASGFSVGLEVEENNVITRYLRTHATAATLEWITQNGTILTSGGNTIGGTLTIGAKDAQIVDIVTGTTVKGISIATTGGCTIGDITAAQAHFVHGNLTIRRNTDAQLSIRTFSDGAATQSYLFLDHLRGSFGASTQTKSGDELGRIYFRGTSDSAGTMKDQFIIRAVTTSDITATAQSTLYIENGTSAVATCTAAGAWTFGLSSTAQTHTINGNVTQTQYSAATVYSLKAYSDSHPAYFKCQTSGGLDKAYIGCESQTSGSGIIGTGVASRLIISAANGITISGDNSNRHGECSTGGAWIFPLIHFSSGSTPGAAAKTAESGVGQGNICSGKWTPTLTNVTNIDASTVRSGGGNYMRIGNVVHCTVALTIDPTAQPGFCDLGISLPIPSAFDTAYQDCIGGGYTDTGTYTSANWIQVGPDTTNDRAAISWYAQTTANTSVYVWFTYLVK